MPVALKLLQPVKPPMTATVSQLQMYQVTDQLLGPSLSLSVCQAVFYVELVTIKKFLIKLTVVTVQEKCIFLLTL